MQLRVSRKSRVKPESAFLQDYRGNITSQFGEDGMIGRIFEIMEPNNKFCVEFGAWDGKRFSNTWSLLNDFGWRGLLIEADDAKFAELKDEYSGRDDVELRNTLVGLKGDQSLDALLAGANAPRDPDFLSIDVDGMDWHIWASLTKFRPRLIVVEFNPTVPNDVVFVQDDDPSVNQGASLLAFVELGKSKRYELVATTECNAFFVDGTFFPAFGIDDNDIDAMHDPSDFETRLFQCYDGTLLLAGCKRLLWSDVAFDQQDIQVLPAPLRTFKEPTE